MKKHPLETVEVECRLCGWRGDPGPLGTCSDCNSGYIRPIDPELSSELPPFIAQEIADEIIAHIRAGGHPYVADPRLADQVLTRMNDYLEEVES